MVMGQPFMDGGRATVCGESWRRHERGPCPGLPGGAFWLIRTWGRALDVRSGVGAHRAPEACSACVLDEDLREVQRLLGDLGALRQAADRPGRLTIKKL